MTLNDLMKHIATTVAMAQGQIVGGLFLVRHYHHELPMLGFGSVSPMINQA